MRALKTGKWKPYLIEAWALGMFMVSATSVVILFEHPSFYISSCIPSAFMRRMCIGMAMGLTAILLIYSKWGKQSGAHMNPAVTLANLQLKRISFTDASNYIIFQILGASVAMLLLKYFFQNYLSHPSVNYIITQPGISGVAKSAVAEFVMSTVMFSIVMIVSNSRLMKYTGVFAGLLVFIFISVEAPLSGMSINPARSFGSAIAAGKWDSFWIYIISPITGMQVAAFLFRKVYFETFGQCKTMKCFMSGEQYNNQIYHVYSWVKRLENGESVAISQHRNKDQDEHFPIK